MRWLSLLPLLLLAGGTNTQSVLLPNKQIVYEYNTTIASGLPEGGSQYSIFTLGGKLTIWTQRDAEVHFMWDEVKVGERNDQFPNLNLRTITLQTQRHPFYEKLLKLPFSAKFQDGKVLSASFDERDEIWSKDLKKGIIDLFQISRDDSSRNPSNEVPGRGPHREAYFWKSKESSVIGKCEVHTTEQSLPYPGNPTAKVLNITKQLNTQNANRTAKFLLTDHPPFRCTECGGDKAYPLTHNIITKLKIEVVEDKYVIPEIYREGIVKVSPMGAKSDSIYSVYNQWLVLRQISSGSPPPKPSNFKEEDMISNLEAEMQAVYKPSQRPPRPEIIANVSAEARRHLNEIAEATLNRVDTKTVKKILSQQILIQKAFSNLPQGPLGQIMEEVIRDGSDKDKIRKKAALDMLARTGTKDAIQVAIRLIQERKVKHDERMNAMMQNIAAHVLLPDLDTAEILLNLCGKIKQFGNTTIQKTCYLSAAEIVGRACVKYNSTHTIRPVPTEKSCPKDKAKAIVALYKRLLEQYKESENEEMECAIAAALGLMNLQASIYALESRAQGQGAGSELVQRTAIYAMGQLGKMFPEDVRLIMFAILYNSMESPENRIAAFAVVIATRPPQGTFDELAAYTWIVKDQQVGAFITSTLRALANVTVPCLTNMGNFARHALKVSNPNAADGVLMGYRVIVDNLIKYLGVGYDGHLSFIGAGGSFIPSGLHLKWQNFVAGYFNNIFDLSGHGVGLRDVFDKLFGPGYMFTKDSFKEILQNINKNIPDQGLDYINQKLGIKPRTRQEEAALLMTLRLVHHKVSQYYVNGSSLHHYFDKALKLRDSFNKSGKVDLIRYMMPLDIKYVIPSAAGHHLHLDVKLPIMGAVRARYDISGSGPGGEGKMTVKFSVEPMLAGKLNVKFGPIVPCRQDPECKEGNNRRPLGPTWGAHYAGGFETTVVVKPTISGAIDASFDTRNRHLKMSWAPIPPGQPENEVVYYKTKPFTSSYCRSSLVPLKAFSRTMRIMDKPYQLEYPIGITTSTDVVIKGSHEDTWLDQADVIDAAEKRRLGGIINFLFIKQRLRLRELRALVDPKSFSSKYTLTLNWDYTPAESDPHTKPKTVRQSLWNALSGWVYVPPLCSDLQQQYKMYMSPKRGYGYRTSTDYPSSGGSSGGSSEEWRPRRLNPNSGEGGRSGERSSEERFGGSSGQRGQGFGGSGSREQGAGGYGTSGERYGSRGHGSGGHSGSGEGYGGDYRLGGQRSHDLNDQIVPLGKGVAVFKVSGALEIRGGKEAIYTFNSTMRSDRETLVRKVDAAITKLSSDKPFATRIQGSYKIPNGPCNFKGDPFRAGDDQRMTGEVEVKWGKSPESMENSVKATGLARKSDGQKELEALPNGDRRKPWYYERCAKEIRRGFRNHEACQRVMDHSSELHHVEFDIDYSQIKNATEVHKAYVLGKRLATYLLFNYMTDDLIHLAKKGHAKLVVKFNDTMPVLDFFLQRPEEKYIFQDIYFGEVLPFLAAPSTRKSMLHRAREQATNYQSPTACLSSGSYLTTFNNVTEDLRGVGDCPYLVTKDCSTGNSFYVLLKNNDKSRSDDKTLIVGILKHEITVNPALAPSNRDIMVDGKQRPIPNKNIDFLTDPELDNNLVAIVVKTVPVYNILLPYLGIRVKFDGNDMKVEASHLWRGKLCGLCGEFRGRRQYNRIGPDQCAYPNDRDLVSQYILRNGSCSGIPKTSARHCGLRSSQAVSVSPRDPCQVNRHHKAQVSRTLCFTTETYPRCAPGCQPRGTEEKEVPAKCFKAGEPKLQDLEAAIEIGPVPYLQKQSPNGRVKINVPKGCVPRTM